MLTSRLARAQAALGKERAVPSLVGPLTLVSLAAVEGISREDMIARLTPAYSQLLQRLKGLGAPMVQLLEPALCLSGAAGLEAAARACYAQLSAEGGLAVHLVTAYDDLDPQVYQWAVQLPVRAISLDFCGAPGAVPGCSTLDLVRRLGFPKDKILGAGVVHGRSVWSSLHSAAHQLHCILAEGLVDAGRVWVHPSTSLLHLPWDVQPEKQLPEALRARLAFAVQKLEEVTRLASGGVQGVAALAAQVRPEQLAPRDDLSLPEGELARLAARSEPYEQRRPKQWQGPLFPTSAIGSYPQTSEVRAARAALSAGRITQQEYDSRMRAFIAHSIGVQEGLGLDVLVHGEAERTDMVQVWQRCFPLPLLLLQES